MRYLIKGKGCRFVFLDHLSLIVSADKSDNERKFIDELMTQLAVLISDTKATLFVISHLTRTTGDKGHENGAEVTLKQLRGSGAIAQLADVVIACERNQQANSEEERNTTRLRVLKNRLVGETGPIGLLSFNKFTGRLSETAEMEEEAL
jgi:twinkle protein